MRKPKPISDATRALLSEMRDDAAPPPDRLDQIKTKVAELRAAELEQQRLSQLAQEAGQSVRELKERTLPDMMDEAGVPSVGIAAEGNMPPYEVRVRDRYHANIPDENEEAAYEYLRSRNSEDLIKTTFTVSFGLRESKETVAFEKLLDKHDVLYSKKQGVPWNTLTAWFREEHRRKPLTPRVMGMLGATVGRVAEVVKAKKEKA